MKITYKTSLEFSNSELKKLYEVVSSITSKEKYLLPRTPEQLAKSVFSVFAFDGKKMIGFGFVYPSCKDKKLTKSKWIRWKGIKLVELGTLYLSREYRVESVPGEPKKKNPIVVKLIELRLDFAENKGYFPVTVTKHRGMSVNLEGIALQIEYLDGEYSEIKSLIRDCHCKTAEQKAICRNCPLEERIVWIYLRFILKKY